MDNQKKYHDAVRYIPLVIEALRSLNGIAKAAAVKDWIAENLTSRKIPIPDTILPSGAAKFTNDIQWARLYLVNAGLLESKETAGHGYWKLTSSGWDKAITPEAVKAIYEKTASKGKAFPATPESGGSEDVQGELIGLESWEKTLQKILSTMPDKGFERLCACIMTENDLLATQVTGQQGDGGIDGEGMLPFDELGLIKMPVAWQCKRYKDKPVSPDTVRDFRGAIQGRASYGLIFTTSVFTVNAEIEARRPGAIPIELVGLERLIELMGKHQIGVVPSIQGDGTLEVSTAFFQEYLHPTEANKANLGLDWLSPQ